ncbi:MAG: hypothetical protein B7Z80_13665, partial [Rhodospirillales bacterium 20-64-7]
MTKRGAPPENGAQVSSLVMRTHLWPEQDQACWRAGTDPITGWSPRRQRHADTVTPRTIELAAESYGRFCQVLDDDGLLDPDIGPAERVTPITILHFINELRSVGNGNITIKTRLFTIATALHIMAPGEDFSWITRPMGIPLDAFLTATPKEHLFVPRSDVLFEWGLSLMTTAPLPTAKFQRLEACRDYRNGLIIALLACRAPRLGSLAQMRIEKNLCKSNGEYWVHLQSMIVKNKRELHYSLPGALTPYIDRYLAEIRPLLLDPASTDAVWGNGDGGAYTYRSIGTMIFRRSAERFDQSFGAHRFRHALASTLAAANPHNPGLAVKRHANGTPDRRAKRTPLIRQFWLVQVANRRA